MIATTLMMTLVLDGAEPAAPKPPGIYFEDAALCSLEEPDHDLPQPRTPAEGLP